MRPLPDTVNTLYECLQWVEQCLQESDAYYGHGTDNVLDEAAYLVLETIGLNADAQGIDHGLLLSVEQKQNVETLLNRRVNEFIPTAYLVNAAYFCGYKFYVNQHVLIPRSPIAELIQDKFEPWINPDKVSHIMDLCTGSGCIAIACGKYFPQAQVDAMDISRPALDVARRNVELHAVSQQVNLVQSDLFARAGNVKYDIIISNPPYVSQDEMQTLPAEYRTEPGMGLVAGEDGLQFVVPILKQAGQYLAKNGILVIEVGNSEQALQKKYPQIPFVWLEFESGGYGVLLIEANTLQHYQNKL